MINPFEKKLRIMLKELEIKKKTNVLSDEEEEKLKRILKLLETEKKNR
jgi:Mg/Co/Ni transporter MgtE